MSPTADALLRDRVQEGRLVESVDEMSDEYKTELRHIVTVSGDTELMSAPAYYYAARKAPSVNAMISAMCVQEAFKMVSHCSRVVDNFALVMGTEGMEMQYQHLRKDGFLVSRFNHVICFGVFWDVDIYVYITK